MTNPGTAVACLVATAALSAGPGAFAATVTFDSLPLGTIFGNGAVPPQVPSQPVHSQDRIDMSVENFVFDDRVWFMDAEVGGRYQGYFATRPLEMENISVRFDFAGLGFDVNVVTLEYLELGGALNFRVNDGAIAELDSFDEINGIELAPNIVALASGRLLTLTVGDLSETRIETVQIGGQELAIDTIAAIPEPGTALLVCIGLIALRRRRCRMTARKSVRASHRLTGEPGRAI